jgi:hypothetical protein
MALLIKELLTEERWKWRLKRAGIGGWEQLALFAEHCKYNYINLSVLFITNLLIKSNTFIWVNPMCFFYLIIMFFSYMHYLQGYHAAQKNYNFNHHCLQITTQPTKLYIWNHICFCHHLYNHLLGPYANLSLQKLVFIFVFNVCCI